MLCSTQAQTWNIDSDGTWNTASNWTPSNSPNSIGANVTLGGIITQQRTIYLTSNRTIGTLNFNSSNTYWVTNSKINWNNTGSSNAVINVAAGQEHWLDSISNLQDNLSVNINSGSDLRMGNAIQGNKALVKNGLGNLFFDLNGVSTFKKELIINAGTVIMERTSVNGSFAGNSIIINSGGTLLLNAPEQIKNNSNITLSGGSLTLNTNGTERVGVLTLTGSSSIDVGSVSAFSLFFKNSSSALWSSNSLTINGWTGSPSGGTNAKIFFGITSTGLTASQLAQISFTGFGTGAILLSNGELVPMVIPEATPIISAIVIFFIVLFKDYIFEIKIKRREIDNSHG